MSQSAISSILQIPLVGLRLASFCSLVNIAWAARVYIGSDKEFYKGLGFEALCFIGSHIRGLLASWVAVNIKIYPDISTINSGACSSYMKIFTSRYETCITGVNSQGILVEC